MFLRSRLAKACAPPPGAASAARAARVEGSPASSAAWLPSLIARRYAASRIVAFSIPKKLASRRILPRDNEAPSGSPPGAGHPGWRAATWIVSPGRAKGIAT